MLLCTFICSSTDLESSQKQVEADKKASDELIRERDILNKVCVVMCLANKGGCMMHVIV